MAARRDLRRVRVTTLIAAAACALGALSVSSCGKRSFLETSKGGTGEGESTGARASASSAHAAAAPSVSASANLAALAAVIGADGGASLSAGGTRLLVTNED